MKWPHFFETVWQDVFQNLDSSHKCNFFRWEENGGWHNAAYLDFLASLGRLFFRSRCGMPCLAGFELPLSLALLGGPFQKMRHRDVVVLL